MIYGSVCSGIEAATVAWHPLGWEPAFFAEIDPFCCAVLKHRYPTIKNRGDFTKIQDSEPIDLLVGGTPCQSFSVAGKRLGLDDPRGNLTLEFLALIKRKRPRLFVWENVPGFLSIDGGETANQFLDAVEAMRYVIDVDILDAQFFGVPQRRRRVFVCGQTIESILRQRTISSGLTISQCLVESLGLALLGARGRLGPDSLSWGFDAGEPVRSLLKRIELFGLAEVGQSEILRENLDVLRPSSRNGRDDSELRDGLSSTADSRNFENIARLGLRTDAESPNTETLWSGILAESCWTLSECITLISAKERTESEIFTCAKTLLFIAERIIQLVPSSPCYWNAASSASTALKEFTNYARRTTSDLFTPTTWIRPWRDFIEQAERQNQSLADIGKRSGEPLFPVAACLSGNPAPSRETREDIARCVATGTNGQRYDWETETFVANSLVQKTGRLQISHSLKADGFDASEDGTGRGTPLVPGSWTSGAIAFDYKQSGETDPTMRSLSHDKSHANGGSHLAVALPVTSRVDRGGAHREAEGNNLIPILEVGKRENTVVGRESAGIGKAGDPMYTLQSGAQHGIGIASSGVRRLTPRECARLQGFPDDWLDVPYRGKPAADGPKYRALGNSMAVPCMRWIGERIEIVERRQ